MPESYETSNVFLGEFFWASSYRDACAESIGQKAWTRGDRGTRSEVGTVTGFSGSGGAIGGVLASLATGYIVTKFSYAPVFLMAGLMHPLSAVLTYALLPDRVFLRAPMNAD